MQIELTFYYSDYWSNDQPHAWKGVGLTAMTDSVYNFTYNFMKRMIAQGTTPQYVSLGNEINDGFLQPLGQISKSWSNFAALVNIGYKAVKETSPTSKVILHLSDGGSKPTYDWFCGSCITYKINYDIIGASYYPFWTKKTATQMREWADYISEKYNKDIILMESGYNWNPTLLSGYAGQLSDNGPYDKVYPSSPQGQKDFMLELFSEIKKCNNGRVLGDLYWDPVMIAVSGVGWELGAPNVVSNTTLFDFNGNSLPALNAFKYN
jgi:arabinogalactan endo-1,4-beta-galactosidase